MNKLTLAGLLAAAMTFSLSACANSGGYSGPANNIVTVSEAQGLDDDTYVVLQGNIKQKLDNGLYVFSDGTGSINVDIDSDEWNGQNINAQNLVVIKGEVDRNGNISQIDVDEVTIIK